MLRDVRLGRRRHQGQPPPTRAPEQARASDRRWTSKRRPCAGNAEEYSCTGRSEGTLMRRFLIVVERANHNFSAYSPDLPGVRGDGPHRRGDAGAYARGHRRAHQGPQGGPPAGPRTLGYSRLCRGCFVRVCREEARFWALGSDLDPVRGQIVAVFYAEGSFALPVVETPSGRCRGSLRR